MGLTIGDAYADATLNSTSYKIALGVKLSGLAALVAKADGAAHANGAITSAGILPAAYGNTTSNAAETRTVRMALNSGTVRAVDIAPPFLDMDERVPVTAAQKQHIVDPVSGLVMRLSPNEELVGPAACDRTIPVYDGLIRFDISLAYAGVKNVQARGYDGPATVCAVRYTPIAGYKKDSQSTRYMAGNTDMEVWLVPVEKPHLVVPFYIKIGTTTGILTIQAVNFKLAEGKSSEPSQSPEDQQARDAQPMQ